MIEYFTLVRCIIRGSWVKTNKALRGKYSKREGKYYFLSHGK
jgi:hypothetical protein